MAGTQKIGKTHRLMRASKNKAKGRGLAQFLKSIKKNGRWRGHKITIEQHFKGYKVEAKPKARRSNRPEPIPNRKW